MKQSTLFQLSFFIRANELYGSGKPLFSNLLFLKTDSCNVVLGTIQECVNHFFIHLVLTIINM